MWNAIASIILSTNIPIPVRGTALRQRRSAYSRSACIPWALCRSTMKKRPGRITTRITARAILPQAIFRAIGSRYIPISIRLPAPIPERSPFITTAARISKFPLRSRCGISPCRAKERCAAHSVISTKRKPSRSVTPTVRSPGRDPQAVQMIRLQPIIRERLESDKQTRSCCS